MQEATTTATNIILKQKEVLHMLTFSSYDIILTSLLEEKIP
jgi:hypothetical protein